jgi:hypothetical protein
MLLISSLEIGLSRKRNDGYGTSFFSNKSVSQLELQKCLVQKEGKTYMIAVGIAAIMPATEKGREASMIGISWNAWLLEVRLYHCMPWRNEFKDDG